MSIEGLPLKRGDSGPAVRDLHQRLLRAGHLCDGELFGDDTDLAVRAFQESRRLEVDGVVGRHTWSALVEAAHRLGDRLLYHKSSPMLRGDDVAELQQRLGALGFDAGRVDGIFGPDTAAALEGFQRNAGLPTDGIFGPDSLAAINRLGGRATGANVAEVREHERLLRTDAARVCKVMLGERGGLGALADTCSRHLTHAGLSVDSISHPDESQHARVANGLNVDLYLGLIAVDDPRCTASYFATEGFHSTGGRHLATLLSEHLGTALFEAAEPIGQRLPVLRETRMPAVVLRVGPPETLMAMTSDFAATVAGCVSRWAATPADALVD